MMRRVRPILLLIVLVGAYRFSLLDRGALAYPDEGLYNNAVAAILHLRAGHLRDVLEDIATCDSRPGDAVVRMIPAALQVVPHAFGVPVTNPRALLVPTGFNVAISLVVLYLFYKICLQLFDGDEMLAITAATVYGLLVNTNLYLRHVLPMDPSLLVAMFAFWLTLTRPANARLGLYVGALAAFTITIYPGYYLLAAMVCIVAVVRRIRTDWKKAAGFAAGCALGGTAVIAVFEIMSRVAGHPYIESAILFSGSVRQGAFDEGWIFLPDYLIKVERGVGVVLLAALLLYLLRTWLEVRRQALIRPIQWILLPAVAALAWQSIMSYHLERFVIYGRLLHPWFIFLVTILIDCIAWLQHRTARLALCIGAVAVTVISWIPSASEYYRLAYPADVLYALGIDTRVAPNEILADMDVSYQYSSPPPLNVETGYPYKKTGSHVLINFCIGRAPYNLQPDPPGAMLIYRRPHYLSFRAYGYEGLTPDDRLEMATGKYDVRVFERR